MEIEQGLQKYCKNEVKIVKWPNNETKFVKLHRRKTKVENNMKTGQKSRTVVKL